MLLEQREHPYQPDIPPPAPESSKGLRYTLLTQLVTRVPLIGLGLFLASLGDIQNPNINSLSSYANQASEDSLTDPASVERFQLQKEIEKKYGIKLLTMQEAYEFMGEEYNPLDSSKIPSNPPVRWSSEKLNLYDELFSYMPSGLYEPINGKDLKLFVASLASTECNCDGRFFPTSGVINVGETTNRELAFSNIIHEATHRLDLLNNGFLQTEVRGIIGDRLAELHSEQPFISANIRPNSLEAETILSLVDTASTPIGRGEDLKAHKHRNPVEGVAQLSQIYIKGYKQFMLSLGPILDGNGKSVKEIDVSASLAENFPKTQALYDLYRKEVFGKKEFDPGTRELIRLGAERTLKMADDYLKLRELLDNIRQDYGIKIEAGTNTIYPGGIGEKKLRGILEAFPRNFYSANDSGELTIYFKQGRQEGIEFSVFESQDVIILPIETFFLNQSQTVITGRSSHTYLNPVDGIANNLSKRRDKSTGYRTRDNIMAILGGEDFLSSPESLFPDLNRIRGPLDPYSGEVYSLIFSGDLPKDKLVRNPEEIVGRLGVLYIRGLEEFIGSLEPFFGLDKSLEIYNQMLTLFEMVEFTGMDQGIPIRQTP